MSNCDKLREMADKRDAEWRAAQIAALPSRLRAAAFRESANGVFYFVPYEVATWNCAGMFKIPGDHPCFHVLERFNNRTLDDATLSMIREEFDKIIEWCMTPPPIKKRWWRPEGRGG